MSDTGRLLVGSVGTSEYGTVTYELGERTFRTALSPVALANLCEIDAALVVRTPAAGERNDERLREGFSAAGVDHEFVDIELITDSSDIDSVLQTIVEELRSDRFDAESIVLDISHSFRSLPIVFLLSLMQFEALEENTTLETIYYSRFAGSRERDTASVIDLTHLRTLLEWYDAFETARRTGTFRGIRLLLEEKRDAIYRENAPIPERDQFSDAVGSFGGAQQDIDAGFPLEAGISTKNALRALSELDRKAFIGPEGMVLEPLELLLEGFETKQDVTEKTELRLTEDELRRQAEMVEFYARNEKYWIAIECARELLINRLLYDAGFREEWLDRNNRELIALPRGDQHDHFTHDVQEVQELWDRICQARNTYAHAGFKPSKRPNDHDVEEWLETLCRQIDNDSFWNEAR